MLYIGRMILIGILLPKATVDMVSSSVNLLKRDTDERSLYRKNTFNNAPCYEFGKLLLVAFFCLNFLWQLMSKVRLYYLDHLRQVVLLKKEQTFELVLLNMEIHENRINLSFLQPDRGTIEL